MIKIWGGSGNDFMIQTDATDPAAFLSEVADALGAAVQGKARDGDWTYGLSYWLPLIAEIWAKLKGYKTDRVREQRVLIAGQIEEAIDLKPVVVSDGAHGIEVRSWPPLDAEAK